MITQLPNRPIFNLLLERHLAHAANMERHLVECILNPKPKRYMKLSKPERQEFGLADGKAVLRRWRKGKPVSKRLMKRAVAAIGYGLYGEGG